MNIFRSLLLCAAVESSAVNAEEKTLRVYNWFD
jgi:putrescine transport system substrate-binding protein